MLLMPGMVNARQSNLTIPLNGQVKIYTSAQQGEPLYKAVIALQKDIEKVTGSVAVISALSAINTPGIIILNSEKDNQLPALNGWEAHHIYFSEINSQQQLILQGADNRGTIYAIYEFSEKILGVPPLWYFINWQPEIAHEVTIPHTLDIMVNSPTVKYRAWFPNDTDMFSPWRRLSAENNESWLEAALRLKMNTIEYFETVNTQSPYTLSTNFSLIKQFGLVATTHHHSPLNSSLRGWESYWQEIRNTTPPALLLSNVDKLKEFWRYNIETFHQSGIETIWVLGFRGAGDTPFWTSFADAPTSMEARGAVIDNMMQIQKDLVIEITGNPTPQFRTIFYDEMSDLMADGYLHPVTDPTLIWNYVASRRDHFPSVDVQQLSVTNDINLGYYFNYQFTSTGSHLVAGEGPRKMEQNYRYLASKSTKPIYFSVVNAGNIREFMMELTANAKMMWDFDNYNTDDFLQSFAAQYFGQTNAATIANLYKAYYNSYWQPKAQDMPEIDRQYIFQDLRYHRAMSAIIGRMNSTYNPNPLNDASNESEPGRTFRIVPSDNGATNQVDAIINGTSASSAAFLQVAQQSDLIYNQLSGTEKDFFNTNLRGPAYFMYYLNEALKNLTLAYKTNVAQQQDRLSYISLAVNAMENARSMLMETQYAPFNGWYANSTIFNMDVIINDLKILTNVQTAFTGGNIVILRAGDGSNANNTGAQPLFLDEYKTDGTFVRTIGLRSAASGNNKALVAPDLNSNFGLITLSPDQQYLTVTGYNAPLTTTNVASTSTYERVIGFVDGAGNVNTELTVNFSANGIRSAVRNGNNVWAIGSGGGIIHVNSTNASSTVVASSPGAPRAIGIFNGQLYTSSSSSNKTINKVGNGLPVTSGQTTTNLSGLPANDTDPYQFVLFDTDNNGTPDLLYYADATEGLKKFYFDGSNWIAKGTFAITGITVTNLRGLTGQYSSIEGAVLFGVTNSSLLRLKDVAAPNANISVQQNELKQAVYNNTFKGVAFAPSTTTLPVELISFTGKLQEKAVKLKWATSSEKDNSHFDVLRSSDGKTFRKIGTVLGNGNSQTKNSYSYTDLLPYFPISYYKLNQVDNDGKLNETDVVAVKLTMPSSSVLKVYPYGNGHQVKIYSPQNWHGTIYITDLSGKRLIEKHVILEQGYNDYFFDTAFLPKTIYMVTLNANTRLTTKFIK